MAEGARRARDHRVLALYRLALAAPACAWLGFDLAHPPDGLSPMLLLWVLLLAALELVATERSPPASRCASCCTAWTESLPTGSP